MIIMDKCPNCKKKIPNQKDMKIRNIFAPSPHVQQLQNTIQRILRQKQRTQIYIFVAPRAQSYVRRKKNIAQADDSACMYAALKVHNVYSQVAVEDEDGGSPPRREVGERSDMFEKFSDSLPRDTSMVIESSSGT
jgi:hypothetical protein